MPTADGVTVEQPAEPRPDPPRRAGHVRRGAGRGDPRRPAGADRPGPHDHRRRGGRRRPRVHRPGRRLRQGAPAVRPPDRHVPGRQAPLRQHGRGHRAGDGRRVGRRPGRRRWWRPVLATPRPSPPSLADARRRPVRQPRHAGARRHRLHVGARLPHLPAPGDGARRRPRRRRRGRRRHRPDPRRRAPRAHRRPAARGRARSATTVRAFVDVAGRAQRGRPQAAPDRRAATPCRTGPSRTAATPAPSSSSSIEQEFGGGQGPPPAVRHHRLGHPDAHPARHRGAGLPLGRARR